ncbi:Gfo/Idh/MocA family protein [Mariniblastus fucicola]|uniref:4-carboxy-2-hydroxymuconate-6-semialdehyde dehydrogenase n=1 Tax=Mariniblastus fucicola TaxID=980251 RepID=A0A5B9P6A6_9BACT|nr:Gfo/Idh/MocA family oxidoreductase [Mariniblastus fucicola]QEG21804.1 4-carboxy-2-hydroxymuconate-6-semialdehyde dehydrogenase [Mariniblastus fucicola]
MSLKVGIVGIGFMGWMHWLAWKNVGGAEVVAVCSRDAAKRAGDWTTIKGNMGPPGEQVDLSQIKAFETLDAMLADDEIDLIDVCLPPAMHRDAIIACAKAGKNIFCEKPLALNLLDCDAAIEACDQNEVRLFVGHVLPFFTEFSYAVKLIRSGEFGKLLGGNFKRVISDPFWLEDFYNREKVGGPLLDLHVHDAHLIRVLFGMPKTVYSGGRFKNGVPEYCNSVFTFEDADVSVACTGGVVRQQGRPFNHAFEIHLEKATMCFEFAAHADEAETIRLKILKEDGSVERPEDLGDPDSIFAFQREMEELVEAIFTGRDSDSLSGASARDAIAICEAEEKSLLNNTLVELG